MDAIDGTNLDRQAEIQLKELDEMQKELNELKKPMSPYREPATDEEDLFPPSDEEAEKFNNRNKVH